MAIVFTKQKKRQRNLIIVFVFVVIIILIVLWQGFFKEETFVFDEKAFFPSEEMAEKEIEINFEIFDRPKVKELVPFEEIKPLEEIPATEDEPIQTKGRENPFIPY